MAKSNTAVKQAVEVKESEKKDTRTPMKEVLKKTSNTSEGIRALAAAGYARAEIHRAKVLFTKQGNPIRYQHVRNVLETPVGNKGK